MVLRMSALIEELLHHDSLKKISPILWTSIASKSYEHAYLEHYNAFQQKDTSVINTRIGNNTTFTEEGFGPFISKEEYYVNVNVKGIAKTLSNYCDNYNINDNIKNFTNIAFGPKKNINVDNLSLIHPGVRHLSENILVFEMPPAYRHLSYQESYREATDDKPYQDYYLPIPWQIYIATMTPQMRLASVQMYFSKTPLYSLDQRLYVPPIFNFYSDGNLCRPFFERMDDIEKYPKDYSGIMASAFDWIWNSGFNWDITENIYEYIYNDKYTSMISLIDSQNSLETILKEFSQNKISHMLNGFKISPIVARILFKLWQQVPLERILEVDWNSFCIYGDFNYRSLQYYAHRELYSMVNEYCEKNEIILISDDEDSSQFSEEENVLNFAALYENADYSFRDSFHKAILNHESKFSHAYQRAYATVVSNNLSTFVSPRQSFASRLSEFLTS